MTTWTGLGAWGYGVGPKARNLLQTYCHCLTMVAQAGGYYGTSFREERGVTQGDPLSLTTFNVVMDVVVWHLVHGVVGEADSRGETRREGRH